MSKRKSDSAEIEGEVQNEKLVQPEIVNDSVEKESKADTGSSVMASKPTTNKTGKMGVYRFLMLYPQDIYMTALLKYYYPNSFLTKEQWYEAIEEIKRKPITR